jgi:hypothetical protein
MVKLKELAPTIETLNQRSNEVNEIIADLNAKLAKLHIGISVADSGPFLEETAWDVSRQDNDGEPIELTRTAYFLGYGKYGDVWELVLVTREDTKNSFATDDVVECGEPNLTPLLQAPRYLRIEALSKVEELLSVLKRIADDQIETITKGRELAKNL